MYLWRIYVNLRGIRNRTIANMTFSLVLPSLRILTPFDDKVFEDNKIPKRGVREPLYNICFRDISENIAEFIKSQLYNKVVGKSIDFIGEIDHIIDVCDINLLPWGGDVNAITCLQKINDLMFDTLLV